MSEQGVGEEGPRWPADARRSVKSGAVEAQFAVDESKKGSKRKGHASLHVRVMSINRPGQSGLRVGGTER